MDLLWATRALKRSLLFVREFDGLRQENLRLSLFSCIFIFFVLLSLIHYSICNALILIPTVRKTNEPRNISTSAAKIFHMCTFTVNCTNSASKPKNKATTLTTPIQSIRRSVYKVRTRASDRPIRFLSLKSKMQCK